MQITLIILQTVHTEKNGQKTFHKNINQQFKKQIHILSYNFDNNLTYK